MDQRGVGIVFFGKKMSGVLFRGGGFEVPGFVAFFEAGFVGKRCRS